MRLSRAIAFISIIIGIVAYLIIGITRQNLERIPTYRMGPVGWLVPAHTMGNMIIVIFEIIMAITVLVFIIAMVFILRRGEIFWTRTKRWIVIVSILGPFILMPNFLEAPTRKKVWQEQYQMRDLAQAIDAYHLEHHEFPPWSADPEISAKPGSPGIPSFIRDRGGEPREKTTVPVIGLGYVIVDSMYYYRDPSGNWHQEPPGYMVIKNGSSAGWIIFSAGPNMEYDLTKDSIDHVWQPSDNRPSDGLINLTYDPTNGTTSRGDLWRTSQGLFSRNN
jgi:hypothetical protein